VVEDRDVGQLQHGEVFAGYRIERLLGVGGMGAVYLAHHPHLPRLVALKLLNPALTDNEDVRTRFLREADVVARLEHNNIVTVHDRGTQDDQLWIAMQYIEGTDAAEPLRNGPMQPDRAVRIVGETADALDYAHELGVLHRDVKPANILLARPRGGKPERVLLADFGIAKALDETGGLTRTGTLLASLQYAPPEQLDATTTLDYRVDVYSLGVTLFHMLTGALPYPGTTAAQLIHGHLSLPIPRASLRAPGQVSPGLDAVIERAMAKNRNDRYGSCGELARDARLALAPPSPPPAASVQRSSTTVAGNPALTMPAAESPTAPADTVRAISRHPPQPASDSAAPTQWAEPAQPAAGRRRRPRRILLVALAALALLVAGIGTTIVLTKDDAIKALPFASLNSPIGVAVGPTGDVYVVDSKNNRVLKLAAGTSTQTTLPFTDLNTPSAVTVSNGGDIFVTDTKNNRVLKLSASGGQQSVLPFTDLAGPAGVLVALNGDLYVADNNHNRVVVLAAGTRTQTVLPLTGLSGPVGLALSADLFVADTGNNRVVAFHPDSAEQTVLPFAGLAGPTSVAVNSSGDVFVADNKNDRIPVLRAGVATPTVVPSTDVIRPVWVAVNSGGDLFVTSRDSVLRFAADG
jgi:serine/threonine protein kinase